MDDELRAAPQRPVRDRVHVADDHLRLHPGGQQRVRPAVDADDHRLEVAHVRTHDHQVALVPRTAGDHEGMPLAKPRLHWGEVEALGKQATLLPQVLQGVLGEDLERLGHPAPLIGERLRQLFRLERAAPRHAGAVAEEACAADAQQLAVRDRVEERCAGSVDQPDSATDEGEGARVRETAALRVGDGPRRKDQTGDD